MNEWHCLKNTQVVRFLSALGPLLLSLYIYISKDIESEIGLILFADDCVRYFEIKDSYRTYSRFKRL